jgi:protein TonB
MTPDFPDSFDPSEEPQDRVSASSSMRPFIFFSIFTHLILAFFLTDFLVWFVGVSNFPEPIILRAHLVSFGELAGSGDPEAGSGGPAPAAAAPESEPPAEEPAEPETPPLAREEIPPPEAIPIAPPLEEEIKPEKPQPKPKVKPKPKAETKIKPSSPKILESSSQGQGQSAGQGILGGTQGGALGTGSSGQGGAGGVKGYQDANYNYIKNRVKRYLVYNAQAKRMGIEGTTTVAFTITASGLAQDILVNKTSGHNGLDQSAVSAVRAASPFPAPPAPARVVIPVVFSLR